MLTVIMLVLQKQHGVYKKFPNCGSNSVKNLPDYIENKQRIVFKDNNLEDSLENCKTALTAWFKLNQTDSFVKLIKYVNIPEYYIFSNKTKSWDRR